MLQTCAEQMAPATPPSAFPLRSHSEDGSGHQASPTSPCSRVMGGGDSHGSATRFPPALRAHLQMVDHCLPGDSTGGAFFGHLKVGFAESSIGFSSISSRLKPSLGAFTGRRIVLLFPLLLGGSSSLPRCRLHLPRSMSLFLHVVHASSSLRWCGLHNSLSPSLCFKLHFIIAAMVRTPLSRVQHLFSPRCGPSSLRSADCTWRVQHLFAASCASSLLRWCGLHFPRSTSLFFIFWILIPAMVHTQLPAFNISLHDCMSYVFHFTTSRNLKSIFRRFEAGSLPPRGALEILSERMQQRWHQVLPVTGWRGPASVVDVDSHELTFMSACAVRSAQSCVVHQQAGRKEEGRQERIVLDGEYSC